MYSQLLIFAFVDQTTTIIAQTETVLPTGVSDASDSVSVAQQLNI